MFIRYMSMYLVGVYHTFLCTFLVFFLVVLIVCCILLYCMYFLCFLAWFGVVP